MKVLHVIDALGVGGGAEHSLVAQLPRLRELGVESSVATLLERDGGLQAEVVAQGFDLEVLAGPGWLKRGRALRRLIKATQPDLVHATLVNSCLLTRLCTVGLNVAILNSLVNTTYDPVRMKIMGLSPAKLRILRTVDSWTGRWRVDHFHAITGTVRDEAVNLLRFSPESITVIPRGRSQRELGSRSNERREGVRASLGLQPSDRLILNVGRQDDQKAQVDLIKALAMVNDPTAVVAIAGRNGSATPAITSSITQLGVADRVKLLGHRGDVADLLVAADLFAFPSLYEGLGCALIEAMALETPIIGSDAPAIAEVLDNGALGVVVARSDPDALALAIDSLLHDDARRQQLATLAHQRFLSDYEIDQVAKATAGLYVKVIEARNRKFQDEANARSGLG